MASSPAAALDTTARQGIWVLAILSTLMGFASISTDLYLPALPTMEASLHSDAGTMEWTISGYLIGFSLGQPFWGPIADRYGRRLPVAIGLVLFVIGSALLGVFADGTPWPMGWVIGVSSIGCAICAWVLIPTPPALKPSGPA